MTDIVSLDEAWAAAEKALPACYRIDLMWPYSTRENPTPRYHASARAITDYLGYIGHNDGGPTPAAALIALAQALEGVK